MKLSVGIPTYNRPNTLVRAVRSAVKVVGERNVVVVDDASLEYPAAITTLWPGVTCIRHVANSGPGTARMTAMSACHTDWMILLDDDDVLLSDAMAVINEKIHTMDSEVRTRYPVVQFAVAGARLLGGDRLISLDDYLQGRISGDFTPVVQVPIFREMHLSYPRERVGAEHLLWWKVAQSAGIPTWSVPIVQVNSDASNRLTSWNNQVEQAQDYAAAHITTLNEFGSLLQHEYRRTYRTHLMGAVTYLLLHGAKSRAREYAALLTGLDALVARALLLMPLRALRGLFVVYKIAKKAR